VHAIHPMRSRQHPRRRQRIPSHPNLSQNIRLPGFTPTSAHALSTDDGRAATEAARKHPSIGEAGLIWRSTSKCQTLSDTLLRQCGWAPGTSCEIIMRLPRNPLSGNNKPRR